MKKNDCFLIKGVNMEDPMIVYHIVDIQGDKLWAKNLYVGNEMVQGWPTSSEYDNDIPDDAIPLPPDSWEWGKAEMIAFVKDTFAYLRQMAIREKPQIKIGGHYVGGHGGIHTVTGIDEDKIRYGEFRLDEDDISPCWKGELRPEDADRWYAISDETNYEVICRYDEFLSRLRKRFCGG
ncbi:MAG: hypothetical protein J5711_05825 [Bacteroidales bacterium]|nr:hypothetical protein [Bacteroidales bacterium]